MFEHAILVQADRLYGRIEISDDDLCTLEPDDFRMYELIVESDSRIIVVVYAVRIDTQPEVVYTEEASEISSPVKLGHIPRQYNKIPARLMDAGKYLYGVVRKKEETGGYYHIVVKIYMQD